MEKWKHENDGSYLFFRADKNSGETEVPANFLEHPQNTQTRVRFQDENEDSRMLSKNMQTKLKKDSHPRG